MLFSDKNKQIKGINIYKSFAEFVKDNPTYFVNIMREQMYSGKNGNGAKIGDYASRVYLEEKRRRNPKAGGFVDLFDTGQFYEKEFVTVRQSGNTCVLTYYSKDEKAARLTNKYGAVIWEFNEESLAKAKQFINREFKSYIL